MPILAGFALVVGAVLGLRCTIAALVPAVGAAFIFAIADSVVQHRDVWSSALFVFTILACLQLGYLFASATASLAPLRRAAGRDCDAAPIARHRVAH
jgi:hypothetical protein